MIKYYSFGEKVTAYRYIEKDHDAEGRTIWEKLAFTDLSNRAVDFKEVMIIGKRTLSTGRVHHPSQEALLDGDVPQYIADKYFIAWLVVWSLHRKPVFVLAEDIKATPNTRVKIHP
jgi:hypothetical protein